MAVRLAGGRVWHLVDWENGRATLCGQVSYSPPEGIARPRDIEPAQRCGHPGCARQWPAWLRLVVGG